jgi:hypothetical protein
MKWCAKCRRDMEDSEVTRATTISELFVCRNVIDCERAAKCQMCQHAWIMKGAQ